MAHNIYQEMGYQAKDECYTTKAESDKLILYLKENNIINKDMIIWLPFDNELSNVYKSLHENHFKTILSNLENGQDFYNYTPKSWDIIISNPPFSGRTKLMKRLISFEKPFIILQGVQYFNNQYAVNYLCDNNNNFKFLLPRSRMSFLTYHATENVIRNTRSGASFYSFWLCYKTNLVETFNALKDNGREKDIEKYDLQGNIIEENKRNIFNYKKERL